MTGEKPCTAATAIIFLIALVAGTGCIIASKTLFELKGIGIDGKPQFFKPPIFQTWIMFFGMVFALPMYWVTELHRRYQAGADPRLAAKIQMEPKVTLRTLLYLGVPAVFDLSSVVLMVTGLMHINASMWMLLRGGGIVFVALMKEYALGDKLKPSMWAGVFIIAAAVAMVGVSSQLNGPVEGEKTDDQALFGVLLTIAGTFMQSIQYVYEEKVMSGDINAPPWLLIGMEGLFGTLLTTFVVYPLAAMVPGADHGMLEMRENTIAMLASNPTLVTLSVVFCVLVFILNSLSVLVTFMLSSVWHAILDNFRPISIWICQLMIFYVFTDGAHGEPWTRGSWLQLAGLVVMLYGTAVYNGSVTLPGAAPGGPDLLRKGDMMSSPSLMRSPLVTMNTAPNAVPPAITALCSPSSSGPGGGGLGDFQRSPYANKPSLDDPMNRGDLSRAAVGLLG